MLKNTEMSVAVLPFENLSSNLTAGITVSQIFITELLIKGFFKIMEETEMRRKLIEQNVDMDRLSNVAIAREMGAKLGVEAVLIGSVSEFGYQHGLREEPAVGFNIQLIRTKDGLVLWRTSQSRLGVGFINRSSIIESAQNAVSKTVSIMHQQWIMTESNHPNPIHWDEDTYQYHSKSPSKETEDSMDSKSQKATNDFTDQKPFFGI